MEKKQNKAISLDDVIMEIWENYQDHGEVLQLFYIPDFGILVLTKNQFPGVSFRPDCVNLNAFFYISSCSSDFVLLGSLLGQ